MSTTSSFDEACALVLAYLREVLPLGFWSVTRVENGNQTYLALGENVYGLAQGGSHRWSDSYCVHMAAGEAPQVAPDAAAVPAYAAAKVNEAVQIGAYAGACIRDADGELFGALCGLDPQPQPELLAGAEPLLQMVSTLLSLVLTADRQRDEALRRAERLQDVATTDVLTGLLNRRGWESVLREEQSRYQRFADPTVVAVLDLDQLKEINDGPGGHAAGDAYIARAAQALRAAVRGHDRVARLGGDEFGLLLAGCTIEQAPGLVGRVYEELEAAGVAGSIGWAPVTVLAGVREAAERADAAMYAAKRRRREARRAGQPTGPAIELLLAHEPEMSA
jgi:diguanylate cyclase (GGDEF)-like protein